MSKKYRWPLVLLIVGVLFAFGAFLRMGLHDAKALAAFSASYKGFDRAISDLAGSVFAPNPEAASVSEDWENKAAQALGELARESYARISSLTRNDDELMRLAREIEDLSRKELDALREFRKAKIDANIASIGFAKAFEDLKRKRLAGYSRYHALAEKGEGF